MSRLVRGQKSEAYHIPQSSVS